MGKVRFVAGRSGSGKSRMFRYEIARLLDQGQKNILLLVPEQFTFETERELAAKLGGGLLGVEVLSMNRLVTRVLQQTGPVPTFISRQGRCMAVRKAIDECLEELGAFRAASVHAGFAQQCEQLISQFKQFDVTPLALKAAAEELDDGVLKSKLKDVALIYDRVEASFGGRFMDTEQAMNLMIERLPGSRFAGAVVYVDGFDAMTGQMLRALEALMELSLEMTVSFCMDPYPGNDSELFEAEIRTYQKLYKLAQEHKLACEKIILPKNEAPWGGSRAVAPEFEFLEKELFAYPYKKYTEKTNAVSLFIASSRTAEVEAMAEEMLCLARKGFRFREMAVVVNDIPAYSAVLTRVLGGQGIPFFMDMKRPLFGHPIVDLILCALDAAVHGFPAAALIRLLKTGFIGVNGDEADVFENYVIANGIKGSMFKTPFFRGEVPDCAEKTRALLMKPLVEFSGSLKTAKNAREMAEALYAYLAELKLYQQLEAKVRQFKAEQRFDLMEENAQIWNIIVELLDQFHELMGSHSITGSHFLSALREGIRGYSVGIIPTTLDQVLVGDVERTKRRSVRALFVLGCNEGVLPRLHPDDAVIDDRELDLLFKQGLRLWQGSLFLAQTERHAIYMALSKPGEKLWISYALAAEGRELIRSSLVDRLKQRFICIQEQSDIDAQEQQIRDRLGTAWGSFKPFVKSMRKYIDTGFIHKLDGEMYAYYSKDKHFSEKLRQVRKAFFYSNQPVPFGTVLAKQLYGERTTASASQLETYNSCPFKYFIQYGLRASPRKEFEEAAADKGSFYHEALDRFTRKVIQEGVQWDKLTKEECGAILDEIVSQLEKEHNGGVLLETAKFRALAATMKETLYGSIWAAVEQIASGSFRPKGSELSFGPGGMFPAFKLKFGNQQVQLSGKIDRIDTLDGEDGGIRVVDYKSGNTDLSYEDIFYGLKLQLPLYLRVASALSHLRSAGAFYMNIGLPMLNETEKDLKLAIKRAFMLNGLVLNDIELVKAMDGSLADTPTVLNVRLTRSGLLSGSSLLTGAQLEHTLDYAEKKAAQTIEEMLSGNVRAVPAKKGSRSTCDWCGFKGICQFDITLPDNTFRTISHMNRDAFLEKTGMEADNGLEG